jgi:transposase-like protein
MALEHSLNANLLQRWIGAAEGQEAREPVAAEPPERVEPAAFLPVALSTAPNSGGPIRIKFRRGGATVTLQWPIGAASECGQWLRELLR